MSSRQCQRIRREEEIRRAQTGVPKELEEEEEEVEDDDDGTGLAPRTRKAVFVFDSDYSETSSDSSVDSGDDEVEMICEPVSGPVARSKKKLAIDSETAELLLKQQQIQQDEEDLKVLETVIEQKKQQQLSNSTKDDTLSTNQNTDLRLFSRLESIDPRTLDIDHLTRLRFGAANTRDDRDQDVDRGRLFAQATRRSRKPNSLQRKFIFGEQKEDWIKPPSYIGGGMELCKKRLGNDHEDSSRSLGASASSTVIYAFAWSKDYKLLQENYEVVQQLHDPNVLVMFLANNPYHAQGFFELGNIFLQMGLVERAVECLRRCLFLHECCFSEGFSPKNAGQCRMNPQLPSNRVFFQALFRYALMTSRQGYPMLAADLALWLLSLDPHDTGVQILLHLDFYLLQTEQYELIFEFCGVHPVLSDIMPMDDEFLTLLEHWNNSYFIDSVEEKTYLKGDCNPPTVEHFSLRHLPNWWMTLSLACFAFANKVQERLRFVRESNADRTSSAWHERWLGSKSIATKLLKQAVLEWPMLTEKLLEKLDNSPSAALKALKGSVEIQYIKSK
jgi:tetratricopeptide (TPR) repeat protein